MQVITYSLPRYVSRIVQIDTDNASVLVHFDGWNQRYDEWLPMTSDQLRAHVSLDTLTRGVKGQAEDCCDQVKTAAEKTVCLVDIMYMLTNICY